MDVFVGVADERSPLKVSWNVNKIGGLPDWMTFTEELDLQHPQCKICQGELYLVVQVYCPLTGSVYHRTLYVFNCGKKSCQQDSRSWSVIRTQKLAQKQQETASAHHNKSNAVENAQDWAEDADDWGSEEDEEEAETIFQSLKASNHQNNGEEKSSDSSDIVPQLNNLSVSATNKSLQRASVETFFDSFYMNVFMEPEVDDARSGEYEQKLLMDYAESEGLSASTNWDSIFAAKDNDVDSTKETYEKCLPSHGNSVFLKFTKRVSRCPEQCVRYCWSGKPLLMASLPVDFKPPSCQFCGAARVFELQLMPSLITFLHPPGGKDVTLDFGTILVYTCSRNCWEDDKPAAMREESAILQHDPYHEILGRL